MAEDLLQVKSEFVRITAIRIYDALLNYYMHISYPEKLDDIDWAEKLQDLNFIRQKEAEASKA